MERQGNAIQGWRPPLHSDDPYLDPEIYDLEYADYTEDIGYYVRLASQSPSPTLELACGTGRLTIPMARAGIQVHCQDLSLRMLSRLRTRLNEEHPDVRQRVSVQQGDFRQLIPRPDGYGAVLLPFNALHHADSENDVDAVLSGIRRTLRPEGLLGLDLYLKDLELYDRDPNQRFEERDFILPSTGETLHSWEQGWWDAERNIHHVLYCYEYTDGRVKRSHLRLHMYERPWLLAKLVEHGFDLIGEWEDFVGTPVSTQSLKWVVQARKR